MHSYIQKIPCALSVVTLALLGACGGGGGGGGGGFGGLPPISLGGGGEQPAATATTLTGTVATGAAFADAALTVFDQTGAKVCEVKVGAEGSYTCSLPAGTKAPLVIQAVRDDITLYSTTASTASGTTNVTPLTTIVVAQLSPNGDPSKLAAAIQANAGAVTAGSINDQVKKLVAALQPLLDALNMSIDPMSGEFKANGTGQDRVLDTINVSVRPDGAAANIEITVKGQPADDTGKPVSLVFRSDDASIAPIQGMATISLETAPPTPAMVKDLLDRMNACYALPLDQRVDSPIEADGNAFGTAANVVAPACRTLFVGDDPANYFASGSVVGRANGQRRSFESLFRAGPTNLKHDRGNFEYFFSNGDIALTYRWTDVLGNTDNDLFNAKIVNGALKITGNTKIYRATVRPQLDKKDFVKQPNYTFHSASYLLSVDNVRDGNGDPILSKVVVTTDALPGKELVLVPNGGLGTLVLTSNGAANGTPLNSAVWRMAARYLDPSQAGSPSTIDSNNAFASPPYTDEQLAAIPDQTVWKMEFFHQNNAIPNVVQYSRTFSRVPTVAEARNTPMVDLAPALRAELVATPTTQRGIVFGAPSGSEANNIDFSAEGDLDGWVVPAGALAPTSFGVFGRAPGANGVRFNDVMTVRTTTRKTTLYCQPVSPQDQHCMPAGNNSVQYAQGASVSTFSFAARTARQVDVRTNFEIWNVVVP